MKILKINIWLCPRHKRKGFTLIELLVACSIAVLIGAGLYKTLSSGISMYKWLIDNKPQNDAVIFFERLACDLRNYCNFNKGSFSGTKDKISFYVHNTDYVLFSKQDIVDLGEYINPSIYRIEYVFLKKERKIKRKLYAFGSLKAEKEMTVLSGVNDAYFVFYGKEKGEQDQCIESISFAQRAPIAIDIKINIGSENQSQGYHRVIEIPISFLSFKV